MSIIDSELNSQRFFRFCMVGIANTAVDFSVFFLLHSLGVAYFIAQIISYSAGILNSYIFNRKWTFTLSGTIQLREFFRFITINGLSLMISTGTLYFLYDLNHINILVSKFAATGGGVLVNYFGCCLWVFSQKKVLKNDIV